MDEVQSTTLSQVIVLLQELPDPRCRRGVRYPWWVLLTTLVPALLAGHDETRAMAQWAAAHRGLLRQYLPLRLGRVPSECTLQRALRRVGRDHLLALINRVQQTDLPAVVLEAVALDGKALRAASTPTAPLHVLQLARHADGALLRLAPVGTKQNEYSASPALLADYPLAHRVVTGDAMFCQRRLAAYIRRRGGHWLFAVKNNQPTLLAALTAHFADPRGGPHPLDIRTCRTSGKGHGRIERRLLEASPDLAPDLDWPGAAQVIRRTMSRTIQGRESAEHSYWLTSLPPAEADPLALERLCRGHWTIENLVNWSRDVTFGEDRCTSRSQHAPLALTLFRSLVRWLVVHHANFERVPDGRRHFAFNPHLALELLVR